jgi:predicted DNA-binding protein (MmcQ/YjbR family)
MHIEAFRSYCLEKPGTTEGLPFGPEVLVFKVLGKMFALCRIEDFSSVNLKCDPERALELREHYTAVEPGYHMSKKHWNTITVNGDVSDDMLFELVDHSYDLVLASLPKKDQEAVLSSNKKNA